MNARAVAATAATAVQNKKRSDWYDVNFSCVTEKMNSAWLSKAKLGEKNKKSFRNINPM